MREDYGKFFPEVDQLFIDIENKNEKGGQKTI